MFPFLEFQFFNLKIPMYGLSILIGLAVATLIGRKLISEKKLCFWDFVIISACTVGFGFAGAKILFVIISTEAKNYLYALVEASSGYVFYGGLICGVAGFFIGVKIAQVKAINFVSIFAILLPIVHGFGRIGCFCGGCCYGILWDGFPAVKYSCPLTDVQCGVGIFPVQLVEAFLLFLLALILWICDRKIKTTPSYDTIFIYALIYTPLRFCLEFFRGDAARKFVFGFSTSQFISIIIFFVALFLLMLNKFNNEYRSL